jgi:hypothetical protein
MRDGGLYCSEQQVTSAVQHAVCTAKHACTALHITSAAKRAPGNTYHVRKRMVRAEICVQ